MRRAAVAALVGLALGPGLALTTPPAAQAQVPMLVTGSPGEVTLLNFAGGTELPPTNRTDVGQASVECDHQGRGRQAVFAGALAWAADATPGSGNDWQYVRVVAGAVDDQGRARTGETSPFYPAYDDRPATLPAVGVALPRDGVVFTPVLTVQYYDSTYRLTGTTMVAAQAGAWLVSMPATSFGDYWYVAADDLVQCD